jgi:hypothetical protein
MLPAMQLAQSVAALVMPRQVQLTLLATPLVRLVEACPVQSMVQAIWPVLQRVRRVVALMLPATASVVL